MFFVVVVIVEIFGVCILENANRSRENCERGDHFFNFNLFFQIFTIQSYTTTTTTPK